MDKASELKVLADKVAKHISNIASDLTDVEHKLLVDILELPLSFPIFKDEKTSDNPEEETSN